MQLCIVYFICKLLYMFRVVSPSVIRRTNNYAYREIPQFYNCVFYVTLKIANFLYGLW